MALAANSGGDSIDLQDLKLSQDVLDAMAELAFSPKAVAATSQIARRETYDFLRALGRLTDVHQLTRATYYQRVASEAATQITQLQYLQAVLSSFEQHGAGA
ncbi:MAG: hypothetical protein LHW56_01650 [Candidatus Cloacimonetes bacterium]|nr:hypothetical protein [Candidatus Cloacimonadota bacterium]MDY0171592.1 hypothetical protein [Candidatus Cloacimonadaceae bacterium]